MHLLNMTTVRNGSFAQEYRVHVHPNGDVLLEVGQPGELEDTCTFSIPAQLRGWLALVMEKAARIECAEVQRMPPRLRLIEGGVGGTGAQS